MKTFFLTLFFFIWCNFCVFSQESDSSKKVVFPFEITFSLNRTTVADGNKHNRFGFGAGFYYPFFNEKRCNLIVGLEYNRASLFVDYLNTNGKWGGGNYKTTYTINNIGIPVCFRVNMGRKVIFFVEAGTFFDINFGSEKGTFKITINNPIDSTTTKIEEQFNNKKIFRSPNLGVQGGIGLRVPVGKHEILFKGDYKFGVRNLIDSYYGVIRNQYWRFSVGFKANF